MKMLALFDYGKNVNTGYATVSRNLVKEWIKNEPLLTIDIVAINYHGQPYQEYDKRVSVNPAYFADKDDPTKFPQFMDEAQTVKNDEFGRTKFLLMLREQQYDLIFIINDVGVIVPLTEGIKQEIVYRRENNLKKFKSVFYFPVDGNYFRRLFIGMEVFDQLVTYNRFGFGQLKQCRPELRCTTVPHGTNITDFYPLDAETKRLFRYGYFGKNSDKFIVGNVNRNQPRKDIPATILGFMAFRNEVKHKGIEPLLYLHMNPKDPLGYDLNIVLEQTDLVIGEDVMFPPEEYWAKGCPVDVLNHVYNCLDVYLTTHKGEGWGLSITEAMRCKVPVIAPLQTSVHEISNNGNNIWPLQVFEPDCLPVDNIIREKCVEYEIEEVLTDVCRRIKTNDDSVTKKTEAAYEFISSLTWEKSAASFMNIFKKLL